MKIHRALLLFTVLIMGILARPMESYAAAQCINVAPCAHWARKYTNVALVQFLDHTGSGWPVKTSAIKWDESPRLNVSWRWHTSGCSSTLVNCVHVQNYNYPDGNNGVTYWSFDANAHFYKNSVAVWLNNYYIGSGSGNFGARWHTACHEMGHAIGLDHNWPAGQGSCMSTPTDGSGEWPLPEDFNWLNAMYNH